MSEYNEESLSPPVVQWTLIHEDPIRREHELPWMNALLAQATEDGLHDHSPGRDYWLGFRDALKLVIEQPEREMMETARLAALAKEAERKREENAGRTRIGGLNLRRLNPGWWNPGRRNEPNT